jgi:chaperonin GroEL
MQATDPLYGSQARKKIVEGITAVHNAVAPTLGPAGKGVLLPRSYNRGQRVVDDGYMAAENVILKDPHARLAADFFKEGIARSNIQNGDGTSGTAEVGYNVIMNVFKAYPLESKAENNAEALAQSILGKTKKKDTKSSREIRKELMDGKDAVIAEIKKRAKPVKTLADLEKIALVSIGKEDETVAKKVAKLVWDTCRDSLGNYVSGHILVTDGFKGEVELESSHGMKFPAKVAAPAFINKPERYEMVAEDVDVFITNHKLDNVAVVDGIVGALKRPKLALFAPDFSDQVLIFMVNLNKQGLAIYPVKCPALRTAQMEDLAAYTDAKVIDKEQGHSLQSVLPTSLGFAERIVVKAVENREDAHLSGGKGERIKRGKGNLIDERIEVLKGQLKEARNEMDRGQLEKRISNLHSAGGTIRVGGATEGESKFIKMKIEDGVYACKGALEMGYVKGGGLALKEIAEELPANILTDALKSPYEQIQKNAGGLEITKDIIDPAKVVVGIVENGVSVAATLITAHAVIAEIPERQPAEGHDEIAAALLRVGSYYAKHVGLFKASEDEAESDRNKEFERLLSEDKD